MIISDNFGIPRVIKEWPNFTWRNITQDCVNGSPKGISFSNFGTVVFTSVSVRRENDSLSIQVAATSGTTAGTAGTMNLPYGLHIDKIKCPPNSLGTPICGMGVYANGSANLFGNNQAAQPFIDTSSSDRGIYFAIAVDSGGSLVKATGTSFPTNGTYFVITVTGIPISEWNFSTVL